MIEFLKKIKFYVNDDFQSHKIRFIIETLAWVLSVGCVVWMAFTVPTPPLKLIYPVWIISCSMYAWSAYTRKSFGMLANSVFMLIVDIIGLLRMINFS